MSPEQFRALFPALDDLVWLDTPGGPPGALPVLDALAAALEQWRSGSYRWPDWELAAADCRQLFARYIGVADGTVALMGSFAEAAATVAAALPPGRIVVGDEEYATTSSHGSRWRAPITRWCVSEAAAAGEPRT